MNRRNLFKSFLKLGLLASLISSLGTSCGTRHGSGRSVAPMTPSRASNGVIKLSINPKERTNSLSKSIQYTNKAPFSANQYLKKQSNAVNDIIARQKLPTSPSNLVLKSKSTNGLLLEDSKLTDIPTNYSTLEIGNKYLKNLEIVSHPSMIWKLLGFYGTVGLLSVIGVYLYQLFSGKGNPSNPFLAKSPESQENLKPSSVQNPPSPPPDLMNH